MYRKALITSLTLTAAAGAISCTAATAAETPTQSGSITIRDNGQPNRDQTRDLNRCPHHQKTVPVTQPPSLLLRPSSSPHPLPKRKHPPKNLPRKRLQKHPLILHSRKVQPPKRKRPPRLRHLLRKRTTLNLVKRPPLRAKQLRVKWKLLSRQHRTHP